MWSILSVTIYNRDLRLATGLRKKGKNENKNKHTNTGWPDGSVG